MTSLSEPFAFILDMTEQKSAFRVPIRDDYYSIGRAVDNHLCLANDKNVSRHHCAIHCRGSDLFLEDRNSRNGTYLEGHRVRGMERLSLPTWLLVGHTRLALIPTLLDDNQLTTLRDATYCRPDSILIPSSSFFKKRTEAFLVVDVVGSSVLVEQKGSLFLTKLASILGQTLERALRIEAEPFLKCTGDGFFACFSRAETALAAAIQLVPAVSRHSPDPPKLSIALHWGRAILTEGGDRTGKHTHAVFALEDIRHHDQALKEALYSQQTRSLILMTAPFRSELTPEQQDQTEDLGCYRLKGLAEEVAVFRWPA